LSKSAAVGVIDNFGGGDYMAKPKLKEHHINRSWCKGCGICVELCPKHVLGLDAKDTVEVLKPQDCICCRLCELRCPDFAIEIETDDRSQQ
jgi:2-oxoglutarate ferredoxin oxidoreductase subunit delta